jgi:hypothetical protein
VNMLWQQRDIELFLICFFSTSMDLRVRYERKQP